VTGNRDHEVEARRDSGPRSKAGYSGAGVKWHHGRSWGKKKIVEFARPGVAGGKKKLLKTQG